MLESCGVSDRPGTTEVTSEESLTLRPAKPRSRSAEVGVATNSWSIGTGDWLVSLPTTDSSCCPADVRLMADEDDCATLSFSFRRYLSFSLRRLSMSLVRPSIMLRCFSTNRHSCAFCDSAEFLSFNIFSIAASGEPADAINAATSARLALSGAAVRCPVVPFGRGSVEAEDSDEMVESIDVARFMMGGISSLAVVLEELVEFNGGRGKAVAPRSVGSVACLAVRPGCALAAAAAFLSSDNSMTASAAAARRRVSRAVSGVALRAGLGARRRSSGTDQGLAT
jgi:hypothetical protein